MEGTTTEAFQAASKFFVQVVSEIPESQWGTRALGVWNLRELVGHANRAFTTVEEYLLCPKTPEPAGSRYFSDEAIAERARRAVADLGTNPKEAVEQTSTRVIALVDRTPADAEVGSPFGTMQLIEYLPSRTAELTIHTLDIVQSLGLVLPAPVEALTESLAFVTRRSVSRGTGDLVLQALSGRVTLPTGYSIY